MNLMISETFRDFYFCYFLSAKELGERLRPSVDEETVKRWAEGEEVLPVGVEAQLYQMLLKLEKREADIWGKLAQVPDGQIRYLSYDETQSFQDLQPDDWQFFFNKLSVRHEFLVRQRKLLAEMGLSERFIDVAMFRPEYEAWLTDTKQQHSEETLWQWAEQEYLKYGSRIRHPNWETMAEAFKRMRKEDSKRRAAKKSEEDPYDHAKHTERLEDLKAAVKKRLYGDDDKEDQIENRSDGTIYLKKRAQGYHSRLIKNETLRGIKARLYHLKNETAENSAPGTETPFVSNLTDPKRTSKSLLFNWRQIKEAIGKNPFLKGIVLTRKGGRKKHKSLVPWQSLASTHTMTDESVKSLQKRLQKSRSVALKKEAVTIQKKTNPPNQKTIKDKRQVLTAPKAPELFRKASQDEYLSSANPQITNDNVQGIMARLQQIKSGVLPKPSEENRMVTEATLTSLQARLQQIKADTAAREESADPEYSTVS